MALDYIVMFSQQLMFFYLYFFSNYWSSLRESNLRSSNYEPRAIHCTRREPYLRISDHMIAMKSAISDFLKHKFQAHICVHDRLAAYILHVDERSFFESDYESLVGKGTILQKCLKKNRNL
jgi:hypothetical protein